MTLSNLDQAVIDLKQKLESMKTMFAVDGRDIVVMYNYKTFYHEWFLGLNNEKLNQYGENLNHLNTSISVETNAIGKMFNISVRNGHLKNEYKVNKILNKNTEYFYIAEFDSVKELIEVLVELVENLK